MSESNDVRFDDAPLWPPTSSNPRRRRSRTLIMSLAGMKCALVRIGCVDGGAGFAVLTVPQESMLAAILERFPGPPAGVCGAEVGITVVARLGSLMTIVVGPV